MAKAALIAFLWTSMFVTMDSMFGTLFGTVQGWGLPVGLLATALVLAMRSRASARVVSIGGPQRAQ